MGGYFAATEHEPLELTAEVISKLRQDAGLTQRELGERLGVTPETVANWENGRTHPRSAQLAIELVRALNPPPERSERTLLLPPPAFTLSEDLTLAAIKRSGKPPTVYFTKIYEP